MTKSEDRYRLVNKVVGELKELVDSIEPAVCRVSHDTLLKSYHVDSDFPTIAVRQWKAWKRLYIRASVVSDYIIFRLQDDAPMDSWFNGRNDVPDEPEKEKEVGFKGEFKEDPSYFKFPPETSIIEEAIKSKTNIFISGPTGCGKTTMLELLADGNDVPYSRMNLNGETSVDDFVGVWTIEGKEMTFIDGILPRAMKSGKMLILDEMDAAQPEILFILQAVLQGSPLMNTKNGEKVIPSDGFFVTATANTVGRGDMEGMYAGVRTLNEAFLDRFHYVLRMDYPSDEDEAKILQKKCGISNKYANEIVKLASACRSALKEGKLYSTFSTRKAINLANAMIVLEDIKTALRVSVLDRVSSADAGTIREAAQRIWNVK